MHRLSVVAAAAIALAGCSQPSGTTTITSNSATGTTTVSTTGSPPSNAAAMGIQPGKWETTVEVTDSKTTGMPPGMRTPPKIGPQTITACVTPDQASRNPAEALKKAKLDCTITNSVFSGGKVASQASCKLPNGKMTMNTTGSYSPTEVNYDTEQTMTMGPIVASQKMHTVSRRVGECDGKKGQ